MIFISYSWKDFKKVHEIVEFLKKTGNAIWIDHEKIDLSKPLCEQIRKGIVKCDRFILIESNNSKKSNWVKYEYIIAKKNIPLNKIIRLRID